MEFAGRGAALDMSEHGNPSPNPEQLVPLASWAAEYRISTETIQTLIDNGYTSFAEIATLDRAELGELGITPHIQRKFLLKAIERP